ncbi:MAG: PLP-dependent aminotransferase family protein [Acidobacteria bacterium]|nr:PLP-dependent aminotransferase family protein [Acidobacteriota bacterium]
MNLHLDHDSHTPLYEQIASQVRALIAADRIRVGDRLPPSRVLAGELKVHRTTISNAYAELEADGLIGPHVGRGTFVTARPAAAEPARAAPDAGLPPLFWEALMVEEPHTDRLHEFHQYPSRPDTISFAYALPDSDMFPLEAIRRSVDRVFRKEGPSLLQLGERLGYEPLRKYLAGRMRASGILRADDEILITNGCQQSLDLIDRTLVASGDAVAIENPTYPGALSVFLRKDTRVIGVPVSERGVEIAALEEVLAHQRVKLIYSVPNFQNPTGVTLQVAERRRLIQLARRYRVPIIEDDIYGDLHFDGPALPPLKALDQDGLVIYSSSISKMGFPGLRIGWVVAPRPLVERLSVRKQSCDLHANLLAQATIYELARQGLLEKHLKRIRKTYAERRDAMLQALEEHFPGEACWRKPSGGMAIWVELPDGIDASALLDVAKEGGVIFSPGAHFYVGPPRANTMRLTFTTTGIPQIREGVRRLGAALKRIMKSHRARGNGTPQPGRRNAALV